MRGDADIADLVERRARHGEPPYHDGRPGTPVPRARHAPTVTRCCTAAHDLQGLSARARHATHACIRAIARLHLTLCHPPTQGPDVMSRSWTLRTAQALVRFGLGRRGGEGAAGRSCRVAARPARAPRSHGSASRGPSIGRRADSASAQDRAEKPPPGERRVPRAVPRRGRGRSGAMR